ncbi:uncharacterized protein [Temnothorax longispinosus]|uniref:uncharacterized protein n=1 Tax=Temnothorax longispinosus TaxID=300112 RepID=UPI003A98FB47
MFVKFFVRRTTDSQTSRKKEGIRRINKEEKEGLIRRIFFKKNFDCIMDDNTYKLCGDCGLYIIEDDHVCELLDANSDEDSKLLDANSDEDSNLTSPTEETHLFNEVQNIEELINEVFKRAPLWDSTIPYEKRGPTVTKFLWSEIDKILNLHPGTANTKWRNLRDTYVRKLNEQKKYIPSGSGAEAKAKPVSWPYFELLGFLRPTVTRRKTFSNIQLPASCSTNSDKHYIEQQNVDYSNQRRSITSDYSSTQQKRNPSIKREKSEILKNIQIPNSSCKNIDRTNVQMSGKKRRIDTNKENDDLLLLQQSVMSEIRATDKSINVTKSDPVITFCNYLTTQLRTLSQDDFSKCQRKILSFVFELQDK